MPFTPFHFGPGVVIHAIAPKRISFLAFCVANILIDIEPLYFILTQQYPLHRFLHTYIGAALIVGATVALFIGARWFAAYLWLPDWLRWKELGLLSVAVGAALGSVSHILLDSLMHRDITPFAPFSDINPLLHSVSLTALHLACVAAGIVGALILGVRKLLVQENAR